MDACVLAQRGFLRRSDAQQLGLSDAAIRWRIESGEWKQVARGIYRVLPEPPDWCDRMFAEQLRTDGVASHRAAAWLLNLEPFNETEPLLELTAPKYFPNREGVVLHTSRRPFEPFGVSGSLVCTPHERTLLDLGAVATLEEVECAVDCAVRRGWTTFERLWDLANAEAAEAGEPGAKVLRNVLTWRLRQWTATGSILETYYLQVIRSMCIPKPVLQYPIFYKGRVIARADFAWPDRRILVETMGDKFHRANKGQLTRDCERENAIGLLNRYHVYKFSWAQVVHQADEVRTKMQEIFAAH